MAQLEQARHTPLHPRETVKNIFLGKPFSLEFYRSFQDKKDLLNEAIALLDGDAILVVSLFLRRTLNHTRFLELMSTRPAAVRQLSNYLETRHQLNDLGDLLTSLGRHEAAGVLHYRQACRAPTPEARARRVKAVLQSHFHGNSADAQLLVEHLHLLERVSPVAEADAKKQEIAADPFLSTLIPPDVGETVLGTLLYCCYHHYAVGENILQSPAAVRKIHKLSEAQFTWVALSARARRGQWKDCEALALTKGWLGARKAKVEPTGVVRLLHSIGAPADVLQTFLQLVEDAEEREEHARRCDVPNVVIDCLVAGRDRLGLQKYRERLKAHSPEWFYADHALSTSNTKWKN